MSVEKPESVGELIAKLATFDRSLPVRVGWSHEGHGWDAGAYAAGAAAANEADLSGGRKKLEG